MPSCAGNATFNTIYPSAFSEWPDHIAGLICKTPPTGAGSAARFAQCCSGTVYNITSPTLPSDAAYPMSCATFCQIDPARNEPDAKYPYSFSDHFMCLTDGLDEPSDWEVVCATNSVPGVAAPTSFATTPTGDWVTKSYSTWTPVFDDVGTHSTTATSRETSTSVSSSHTTTGASITSSAGKTATTSAITATTSSTSGSRTSKGSTKGCLTILMLSLAVWYS